MGRRPHRPVDAKIIFSVRSLSSGIYDYKNGELVYAPEVEWAAIGGFVKFANRAIILEFGGTIDRQRVEIPYRIVEAMTIGSRQASLTLTLWEAPRFFLVTAPTLVESMAKLSVGQKSNVAPRTRLVHLKNGAGSHREVVGQSLVYQICVSPAEFALMSRRLHERAILTLHYRDLIALPSYQRNSLVQAMKTFSDTIQSYTKIIPFAMLYQMEALVRNGFLPPWTVGRLLEKLRRRLEAASNPRTPSKQPVRFPCLNNMTITNKTTRAFQ
jgi:hypothetical protein